jgi:hypothetical protein
MEIGKVTRMVYRFELDRLEHYKCYYAVNTIFFTTTCQLMHYSILRPAQRVTGPLSHRQIALICLLQGNLTLHIATILVNCSGNPGILSIDQNNENGLHMLTRSRSPANRNARHVATHTRKQKRRPSCMISSSFIDQHHTSPVSI